MYGLPKMHKTGVPMRPITSGIGSAPHRLAKLLAKPLSEALGKVSGAHLRNSSDLMQRLQQVGFRNKTMVSFDVKSLFTNVPVDAALEAAEQALQEINQEHLPLPKSDYLKAVRLCVQFGAFKFNEAEFQQHTGLAMGSPLSPVLACLYMETLERSHYKTIVGRNNTWLWYVDDVLVLINKRCNLQHVLQRLNAVEDKIQFTMEQEDNDQLSFLDTTILKTNDGPKFKVYRKPTNKDDFIHFLSAHSHKTKTGVALGFYLRAFRISSPEFLEAELTYVTTAFKKLAYPEHLLLQLQGKARKILKKEGHNPEKEEPKQTLLVPNNQFVDTMGKHFKEHGVRVISPSGSRIKDLVQDQKLRRQQDNPQSVVYAIPCASCDRSYIGETGRGLKTRLREHQRDLTNMCMTNALVVHADKTGHLPSWSSAQIIFKTKGKEERKALESAKIATSLTTNTKPGNFLWATIPAKLTIAAHEKLHISAQTSSHATKNS